MSLINKLIKQQLIHPPSHLKNSIQYEVIMGSNSYGVSNDNSDIDIYGFSIPYKNIIFPHLDGEIYGFGTQKKRYEQYQQHHIKSKCGVYEYDITIYNIIKFFNLCMQNNPNMIDCLFVPRRCIINTTQIGEHVRENRKIFLHKGAWHRFKGYSYSMMHKMNIKKPDVNSNRYNSYIKYNYDLKYAYHLVRLLSEIEQILTESDLDLEKNREQLKSIRRGEWSKKQIENYFQDKENDLEKLYIKSSLPHKPDEIKIKKLLIECLEMYFGSLDNIIQKPTQNISKLKQELLEVIDKY